MSNGLFRFHPSGATTMAMDWAELEGMTDDEIVALMDKCKEHFISGAAKDLPGIDEQVQELKEQCQKEIWRRKDKAYG
jgi:hypothetical protein